MKPKFTFVSYRISRRLALPGVLPAAVAMVLSNSVSPAATLYWDNVGGTANDWGSLANWSTVVGGATNPAALPGTLDIAQFSATSVTAAQTVNLNGNRDVQGLIFSTTLAHSLLGGGTNRVLTLGTSGISKTGTGAATIGSATAGQQVAISLGAAQTWSNTNNTGAITVPNGVSLANTGDQSLTLGGTSTAANTVSGVISNGAGILKIVKAGAGNWTMSGANTFSGGVEVDAGVLTVSNASALGSGTVAWTTGDTGRVAFAGGITYGNNFTVGTGVAGTASQGLFAHTGAGGVATLSGTVTLSGLTGAGGAIAGSNTSGQELRFNGPINQAGSNIGLSQRDGRVIYAGGGDVTGNFVSTGTVLVGATNGIPQGLVLNPGGSGNTTVNLNGFDQTSAGLVLGSAGQVHTATVSLGAKTLTLTGDVTAQGTSPAHVINATAGSGTLALGAANRNFTINDSTAADDLTLTSVTVTGAAGFTKLGAGTMALNNAVLNTALNLSAGTLRGSATGTGSIAVGTGTILVPGTAATADTLAIGSLAFDSGTHAVMVNLGSGPSDAINVTNPGGLATNGGTTTFTIAPSGSIITGTTYNLITYAGTSPGTTGFALATLPGRVVGSLTDTGTAIALNVTGNDKVKWTGTASGTWDINTSQNWKTVTGATDTNYLQGDDLIFDDSGSNTSPIALGVTVNPAAAEFQNTTAKAYTISGAGGLAGSMTFAKTGDGTVTLDGTGAHSFTGATTLNSGTLAVNQASSGLTATSGVAVASGATLRLFSNNADFTFSRNLAGAGTVVIDPVAGGTPGTVSAIRGVTLSGTSTGFSGKFELTPSGTYATNGTFRVSANQAALGTASVTVADRAQLWATTSITNNLTLSGAGALETAGGTPAAAATGADGSVQTTPTFTYGAIGALRMSAGIDISGSIKLVGDAKINPYGGTGTLSGTLTKTDAGDTLVAGGGTSSSTLVLTGDASGLGRIWVNGGGTTGTNTLVIGNNTTTGSLGSGDVILYQDAAAAIVRFQRSDGYALASGQNIIAAAGTATNLTKAAVHINTPGAGFTVGASTIDLSNGTNGGSISVGTNLTGAVFNIGTGAVIETGYFGVGEQTNNSATVNQTNGNVFINGIATNANNNLRIGHYGSNTSTYNLSAGTLVFNAGVPAASPSGTAELGGGIYVGIDGTGIFNQSGGLVSTNWIVLDNRGNTAAGTNMPTGVDQYNLSGGVLELKSSYGIIARNVTAEVNLTGGGVIRNAGGFGTDVAINTQVKVTGDTILDTGDGSKKFTLMNQVLGTGTLMTVGGGLIELEPDSNGVRTGTSTGLGIQAIAANIAGSSAVTKLGTGISILAGANSYTGATTVAAGMLHITGVNTVTGPTTVAAGGVLQLSGSINSSAVTLAVGGNLRGEGSAASIDFGAGPTNLQIDGSTAGALQSVGTLAGSGTVTVDFSAGPTTPGPVTVLNHGGTAMAASNFALLNDVNYRSKTFAVSGTAVTLDVGNKSLVWAGTTATWELKGTDMDWAAGTENFYTADSVTFNDSSATNSTVALVGTLIPAAITVNSSTNLFTLTASAGNTIAGGGTLLKKGSSVLSMAGNTPNTFSGGTTLSQGEIRMENVGSLGTGGVTMGDTNTGSGNLALYLDTNRPATDAYVTTVVISSNGTGTATLGSRSSIGGTGAMGFSGVGLARDVIFDSNAADRTDYKDISGTGNITITGAGRTVFAGANSFTGNVAVNVGVGGTFQLGSATAGNQNYLPDTAILTVTDTPGNTLAEVRVSAGGETIAGLTGNGTIDANGINGTLTVGFNDTSSTFAGEMINGGANTVGLTKIGTGTLTLTGTNTTTGTATVSAGLLQIGTGGTSGSIGGGLVIAAGATANLDRSDASAIPGVLGGAGTLNKNGAGDLSFNGGGQSFTGTINVNGGAIIANSTNPWNSGTSAPAIALAAGTTLTNTTNSTHAHVGNLTMAGGSIWTTGAGTGNYAGENYQLNGTVTVTGGSTAALISREGTRTNADSGISLRGNREFNVADVTGSTAADLIVSTELEPSDNDSGVNQGALTKTGLGTMVLAADNSYTGVTNVDGGTLLVNNSTGSGTGLGAVNVSTATLGGSGMIAGTVNIGGVLAPGNSIESLATGMLNLNNGATLSYEAAAGNLNFADLVAVAGDLNLNGTVTLDLTGLADTAWTLGDKLTIASYTGTWNSGTFDGYADGSNHLFGPNDWKILYADTTPGKNFTSEQAGKFLTLTLTSVVPEPSAVLLLGVGALGLGLRRRREK